MRVPSSVTVAIVVILSSASSGATQNVRDNGKSSVQHVSNEAGFYKTKEESHFIRSGGQANKNSGVLSTVTSRLLGRRGGNRWQDRERPTVERDGEDDTSGNMDRWKEKANGRKKKIQATTTTPPDTHEATNVPEEATTTKPPGVAIQAATMPPEGEEGQEPTIETAPIQKTTQSPVKTDPPNSTQFPIKTDVPEEENKFYKSTSGIFDVQIPLFSSLNALGYLNEKDLYHDLVEATKYKVNRIVEYNIKYNYYYREYMFEDVPIMAMAMEDSQPVAAQTMMSGAATTSSAGVDDFVTNTVEDSIDDSDSMKTDGTMGYAAYGDTVVI